jgi:hypothetical protein
VIAQKPAAVGRRYELIIFVGALIATGLYLACFVPSLLNWPPVNGDEGRELNAFWVTSGIDPTATTLDPTYGHDPLYKGGLQGWTTALSFRMFGFSLWAGRIVSMFWGGLLLFSVFLLGWRMFGVVAAAIAALLLAVSQPFLVSTHIVRPDIVVAALLVLSLLFAQSDLAGRRAISHVFSGLMLGLAFDVHPNTVAFMPMVGLVYLFRFGPRFLLKRDTWLFVSGIVLGAMIYVGYRILPDPTHYFDAFRYWVGVDKRPPSLRTPGLPMFLAEWSRFTSYFEGRVIEAVLVLVGLAGAGWRLVRREAPEPLLPGLLIAFLVFMVLVSSKTEYYMILFYPMLLLLVGRELATVSWRIQRSGVLGVPLLAVVILAPMGFEDNLGDITKSGEDMKDRDYVSLTRELRAAVTDGASVLAPPVYWPGLWDHPFTDIVTWERVKAERNVSFPEFTRGIKPDYVLLDVKSRYEVFRTAPRFMDEYAQLVTTIRHVGYGRIEVWKRRADG